MKQTLSKDRQRKEKSEGKWEADHLQRQALANAEKEAKKEIDMLFCCRHHAEMMNVKIGEGAVKRQQEIWKIQKN